MISINHTCENEHPLYCRFKNIYRVSEYRILALYWDILWKLQISIRYRISIYSRIFNRDLSYLIIGSN